jgi:hypothetical protein
MAACSLSHDALGGRLRRWRSRFLPVEHLLLHLLLLAALATRALVDAAVAEPVLGPEKGHCRTPKHPPNLGG